MYNWLPCRPKDPAVRGEADPADRGHLHRQRDGPGYHRQTSTIPAGPYLQVVELTHMEKLRVSICCIRS